MVSPSLRDLRDEVVNLMRETTFSGLAIAKPFIDMFGLHAVALAKTSEPLISPSEIDGLESALITDFSMVASSSILARNQSSDANELSNSKYLCTFWPEQWHGDLSSVSKKAWSISYSLFLLLDNKLTQRNILHSLGSEKLKKLLDHHTALFGTEYIIPKISDFHRLYRQFDAFVVTAATSAGGSGIFLVKNIGTYAAAIDQIATPVVRIEKFNAQTVSLTQFGIVFEESVFLYEVQVQYVKELNHHLVYAGASWDTGLPRAALEEATSVSREVGLALSKMGYLGAFGCDLLFEQGTYISWS
jgi:hypothetical protein